MKENMLFALEIIIFMISLIIVIIGLLQGKKNHNGLGALSGGNQELFASTKERGWTRLFSMITMGLGISLFVITIIIRILINSIG